MAIVHVKQSEYPLHPAGKFVGTIIRVDTKMVTGEWGEKEKILFEVETDTDDGRQSITAFFTLSFGPKCVPNLRKFRESVLDHPLSAAELSPQYDTDELLGKRITFRVDHVAVGEKTYANIREGSVEPAGNAPQTTGVRQDNTRPVGGATRPQPAQKQDKDSDLPF